MRTEDGDEHPNAVLKQIGEDRGFFRRSAEGRADRLKLAGHVARAIDIGPRQFHDRFRCASLAASHAFAKGIDFLDVDPAIEFKQEIDPPAEMIIGDRLGDTCSLGEARKGEPVCSLFADHASCDLEELAMPVLVGKALSSGRCARSLRGHMKETYQT